MSLLVKLETLIAQVIPFNC